MGTGRAQAAELPTDPTWWAAQFDEGRGVADIASQFGTNHMHVYRHLRRIGVETPRAVSLTRWLAARTTPDGSCLRWNGLVTHGRPMGTFRSSGARSVRRIVWEETHGPLLEEQWVVRTTDCSNVDCVAIEHLRVVNAQAHVAEGVETRRFRWGEKHGNAKLTESQARSILSDHESSRAELAERFGISPATVYAIRTGQRWAHLADGDLDTPDPHAAH